MQTLSRTSRALGLLARLNGDLVLFTGAISLALYLGVWLAAG